jgi:hypothetical protein
MLDSYLFAIIRTRHPEWAERLWSDLASQRFGAVVLERDPHSDRGRPRYAQHFFGEGFVERLEQSYEEAGRIRERVVYRPKRR